AETNYGHCQEIRCKETGRQEGCCQEIRCQEARRQEAGGEEGRREESRQEAGGEESCRQEAGCCQEGCRKEGRQEAGEESCAEESRSGQGGEGHQDRQGQDQGQEVSNRQHALPPIRYVIDFSPRGAQRGESTSKSSSRPLAGTLRFRGRKSRSRAAPPESPRIARSPRRDRRAARHCRDAPMELPFAHPRRGASGGCTAPTGGKSAGICRHSARDHGYPILT